MKRILFIVLLFVSMSVIAQTTGKSKADITKHGNEGNSTKWIQEYAFVDSGATSIGPFSADQPPIAIAITRDAVWDSTLAGGRYAADGYHWDSTWTASDLGYLFGFQRPLNDSARTTITMSDSLDFLPLFKDTEATARYVVQADSMRYIVLPPVTMAGAKYFYLEFYDATGDSLVPQAEPRTILLFYREY